ncbi:MAG TPA: arginine--tRNA ligase [Actinomycetota bacterium]|nr:arginine--tRNA ligase [Actinomycetota bacterium]
MIEERLIALVRMALAASAGELGLEGDPPPVELSTPKKKEHGDFATNAALALAGRVDRPPREVADVLVGHLPEAAFLERVEIAGPGFVNFFVTDDWLHDTLRDAVRLGPAYGRGEPLGRSVQVEFVSANPTGPLHIGTARNAVIGDAIAAVMEAAGWTVGREYYFNDAGRQMDLFGASVEARYLQRFGRDVEIPDEGYHGAYIGVLADELAVTFGDALVDLPEEERHDRILHEGAQRILAQIERTLQRFGVRFDRFVHERELHESGEVQQAVARLRAGGHVYDADGAVWFRSTDFGDDKDRPLIRSNGAPTYFAADCAYVVDKFRRGFDHVIYVWGADHHGDVARVKGAAEAMGFDPGAVEIVLYQFVTLYRGGELVRMSKRAGDIITLDELLDEVGVDATRFTLLSRSNDSPMDFDIELVKRQTMDNPVYYVQYGHARIASILRHAAERGVALRTIGDADLSLLSTGAEVELLKAIAEVPAQVAEAAELRAPHRLTYFVQELASRFHRFYTECRVVTEDEALTQARLWLCTGAKLAIANVLGLLGVSAPEEMERVDA